MRLVTYYYRAPGRQQELDYCLLANAANPRIDDIVVIVQRGAVLPHPVVSIRPRVVHVSQDDAVESSTEGRPYLDSLFRFCDSRSCDGVTILANADVFFDGSVLHLHRLDGADFAALSVWELDAERQTMDPRNWNNWQSAWAWRGRAELADVEGMHLPWGSPGMDNRLCYLAGAVARRVVQNPALTVRAVHVHANHSPTFGDLPAAPYPWGIVAPHEVGRPAWVGVRDGTREVELGEWLRQGE
jgi:hypothetical protein